MDTSWPVAVRRFPSLTVATPRLHVAVCRPSDVSKGSSLSRLRSLSAWRTPAAISHPGRMTRNSSPP